MGERITSSQHIDVIPPSPSGARVEQTELRNGGGAREGRGAEREFNSMRTPTRL